MHSLICGHVDIVGKFGDKCYEGFLRVKIGAKRGRELSYVLGAVFRGNEEWLGG
ncbi:hypothetical protein J2736_004718 [Paenibacillus qinlingensis]|uniref:Uncharacterized protein n=1 Tax=Paenibacillus qinlingensis TaxID=1837343 RepID=A0ABU1P196_9BACL|nr:hypothetical protein [Paenibacillus qinlingensis]